MTPETEPSCSGSTSVSCSTSGSSSGSSSTSVSCSCTQQNPWERLPTDIMNIVLEYHGYHIFRNGKYMRQLEKKRMNAIRTIPTITRYLPTLTHVNLDSRYEVNYIKTIEGKTYKNTIRTIVLEDHVVWVMTSYAIAPLNYMFRGRMGWSEPQVKTEKFVVYE